MALLVVAEHDNQMLKGATLNAVAAATAIGGELHVLVAGSGAKPAADAAARVAGVAKVLLADDKAYEHPLAEDVANLVIKLAPNYSHVLAPATSFGKNVMPRVAALLDVAQISDISGVQSPDTFVRPIYAGNALVTVQSSDKIKVITVRGTAFPAAASEGGKASVESTSGAGSAGLSRFVGAELSKSERPELTSARVIVSGGRGQAGRRRRRVARRVRCRLRAQRLPGRPDRQDRGARALYRRRHLRRHPASGRDEGFESHRRHQQGRGGADLPGRRLRPGRRSVQAGAGARCRARQTQGLMAPK
jgi:electron transfer flavoprotein alpha subunit